MPRVRYFFSAFFSASASTLPSRVESVTPVSAANVGAISAGVTGSKYSPG